MRFGMVVAGILACTPMAQTQDPAWRFDERLTKLEQRVDALEKRVFFFGPQAVPVAPAPTVKIVPPPPAVVVGAPAPVASVGVPIVATTRPLAFAPVRGTMTAIAERKPVRRFLARIVPVRLFGATRFGLVGGCP